MSQKVIAGRLVFRSRKKKESKLVHNLYVHFHVYMNINSEKELIDKYNRLKSYLGKSEWCESNFIKWLIGTIHDCVFENKCEDLKLQSISSEEYARLRRENEDLKVKVRELESEVDRLRRENVDLLRKVNELLEEINKNVVVKCESITIGVYRVTICGKGFIVDYLTNMDIIRQKFLTRDEYINFVNLLQRYGLLEAVKIERVR